MFKDAGILLNGGEGGIPSLLRHPGARDTRPSVAVGTFSRVLTRPSIEKRLLIEVFCIQWRRGRDSNPRGSFSRLLDFQSSAFSRAQPPLRNNIKFSLNCRWCNYSSLPQNQIERKPPFAISAALAPRLNGRFPSCSAIRGFNKHPFADRPAGLPVNKIYHSD